MVGHDICASSWPELINWLISLDHQLSTTLIQSVQDALVEVLNKEELIEVSNTFAASSNLRQILFYPGLSDEVKDALRDLIASVFEQLEPESVDLTKVLPFFEATLSSSDQVIYEIILKHDQSQKSLLSMKTISWGRQAFDHFNEQTNTSTMRVQKIEEVLSIFYWKHMRDSIQSFPFDLELNQTEYSKPLNNILNPRFVLPLMFHQISPQNLVNCHKFVELKGLSYSVTSLSSNSLDIRKLGYSILTRFYGQLESSTFYKDRILWMSFLDNLRCGVKEENEQLPRTVTLFLTKVIEVLMSPDHFMNEQIRQFLTQVSQFDGDNVVKFLISLLVALDAKKHLVLSEWSLKLLTDSINTDSDFELCQKHGLFSLVMQLSHSQLTNLATKKLILHLLENVIKLELAVKTLSLENSLSPWLLMEVTECKRNDRCNDEIKASVVNMVVQVCSAIVKKYKKSKKQSKESGMETGDGQFGTKTFEDEMLFMLEYARR